MEIPIFKRKYTFKRPSVYGHVSIPACSHTCIILKNPSRPEITTTVTSIGCTTAII